MLLDFLANQPKDTVILLRRGNKAPPGPFEEVVMKFASMMWLEVEWVRPDPEDGPGAVFLRDVEMASRSDLVLCFFDTTQMSGGTAHVVEAAMSKEVPVYAWGFDGSSFKRIGEWDPDERWGSVPG